MSDLKLYARRIGLVGITNALVSLSVILLLPILTKNLSIEDYGIWVQANVTITLLPAIIPLGLSYTMVRFLAAERRREKKQEGFYSIFIVVILMSVIASLLLFLLAEPIASKLFNNNIEATRAISLVIFIECLNNPCISFFRTFLRMKVYSTVLVVKTYLNVLLVSFFVLSGQGVMGALTALLITSAVIFLLMLYLIIKDIGIAVPRFERMREYLAFGLPTIPGNLSSWIINSSSCYVISILLGIAYVGYYSPGYSLGNINLMFMGPFSVMLSAVMARYYEENDLDSIKTILNYSTKYFLAIAIPSTFGLALLSKSLLMILSPPQIALNGYLITPFVALSALFYGMYVFFAEIIAVKKKTAIMGRIWVVAAILSLGLNLILIPRFGIIGGAASILITYAFALAFGIYYSRRYIPVNVDLFFVAKSILSSILMSLIIVYFQPSGLMQVLAVTGACAIFYCIALILLKGFNRDELRFLKGLMGIGAHR